MTKKTVRSARAGKKTPAKIKKAKSAAQSGKKKSALTPLQESRAFALACAKLIKEKKGADIVILDVSKLLQITDYFIVCTGKNKKQNQAIADNLQNKTRLAKLGFNDVYPTAQGYESGMWVLVDMGRVVVHIFIEVLRRHYDLEFLWANAPRVRK